LNPYYEKIVVGSSLRALLYASLHGLPVFFSKPEKPFQFDLFDPEVDLSPLGLTNEPIVWKTPDKDVITGQKKESLWEHLIFILGLKGLIPFSNLCHGLRLEDNTLTGFSEYAKLRSVDFGECLYFDEHDTYSLLSCKDKPRKYLIYDRIAFIRGGKHKLDLIESNEDFMHKIWFYDSHRVLGRNGFRDACVASFFSEDQVDDFDFSETVVRLQTVQKMKDLGLRGPRNGYQYDGKIRYRSFKTETIDRYKFLVSPPLWQETSKVKVPKVSEKELLQKLPEIVSKNKRILEHLWQGT
jgi:hypothetical protein